MSKPVGGRGKKAPYETQQMRVPVPVKEEVNELITDYRESLHNRGGSRINAGRKSNWSTSETQTIRVPSYLVNEILVIAHDLDRKKQEKPKPKEFSTDAIWDKYYAKDKK